jgi:hypothetical protein
VGIANANSAGIPATPQPASVPITIAGYDCMARRFDHAGRGIHSSSPIPTVMRRTFPAGALSGGVEFTFKGGTVINAGGSLYVSPRQAAFRSPHG